MPRTQVDFDTAREILAGAGIPLLGRSVQRRDDAIAAARAAGFPVVMKLVSPQVVHKSDAGMVLLDIADADAAGAGFDTLMERARAAGATHIDGVLVQPQGRPGFELLVGARQDPVFGPLTMIGYGGRYVELFKDVWPGVGVLDKRDVERMLGHTLAGRVIDGFRGPRLDRDAAIDLAVKVSRLMEARHDVHELDLNPVILYEQGFAVVDARVITGEPVHHPRAEDLSYERLTSLNRIFEARSVAVVGASRPGTVGGIILKNSSSIERLYAVTPTRDTLMGHRCYPSIEALPEVPDVAVFAVRPELTVAGFKSFCAAGGKGAIIVSDGFAEIGRQDLEDQLVATSRAHDVVYIGPNGLGVFDTFCGLNTMFLPRVRTSLPAKPGPVGIISQSGGIGTELLEMAAADDLRVGKWVSCGNASGVSIPELMVHMGDDPRITILAIYLEGLTNGRQFMEVARKIARQKPILIIKGGVAGGAAATMSHTASLAGSFEAFRAACDQSGVYLMEELTEDPKVLLNILSLLTTQKPAKGKRMAVVSVGGGAGILLADQITSQGMQLAEFGAQTRLELGKLLGHRMHGASADDLERIAKRVAHNPLDLFGDANDDRLIESLRILDADDNVDAIVMALYFHAPYLTEYLAERLAEQHKEMRKPLVMSLRGFSPYVFRTLEYMIQNGAHCYTVPMVRPLAVAVDIWLRYGADFSTPPA
jgi:3-hydroxypropionyl-CoA synthetase (ADP-forming)